MTVSAKRGSAVRSAGIATLLAALLLLLLSSTAASRVPSRLLKLSLPGFPSSSTAPASATGRPQQPGQAHQPQQCSIYTLDPAQEFGLPACNYSDPAVWPFDSAEPRYEGTAFIKHFQQQFAAGYWVADAIRRRGAAAGSLAEADLVSRRSRWLQGMWTVTAAA